MKQIIKYVTFFFIGSALLIACKKDPVVYVGDYPDKAKLIFINAAGNAATVAAQAQREIGIYPYYNGTQFNNFPIKYPWSNGYKVFTPGTLVLKLDTAQSQANNPPGPGATVGTYNLSLEANSYYSMYAVGTAQNVDTFFVKDDLTLPTVGKVKIRLMNLSTDAGPVDIVNSATGMVLAANISYKKRLPYIEVDPSNSFSMQMNIAGTTTRIGNVKTGMVLTANSVYSIWVAGFRTLPSPGNSIGNQAVSLTYHANLWAN